MMYLIHDSDGELVDVLEMSIKQVKEYEKNNPTHILTQSRDDLDDLCENLSFNE